MPFAATRVLANSHLLLARPWQVRERGRNRGWRGGRKPGRGAPPQTQRDFNPLLRPIPKGIGAKARGLGRPPPAVPAPVPRTSVGETPNPACPCPSCSHPAPRQHFHVPCIRLFVGFKTAHSLGTTVVFETPVQFYPQRLQGHARLQLARLARPLSHLAVDPLIQVNEWLWHGHSLNQHSLLDNRQYIGSRGKWMAGEKNLMARSSGSGRLPARSPLGTVP